MKWILILFSVITMKTCDNLSSQKPDTMFNSTYNIITLNGKDISEFNLKIAFNDSTKQVSGFSGCNRFLGSFTIEGETLRMGPLASTRKMCLPELNTIESEMLDILSKEITFSKEDSSLRLLENKTVLIEAIKKVVHNHSISFEYSKHSRGAYQNICVSKKSIIIKNKRVGDEIGVGCSEEQWQNIIDIIKNIDIERIQNLEAPSQKRLYDGAAIAKLKIIYDGKTYETPSFDHGNPNPYIANLVKEILSIAQNIE
ncbi:META domain-containing protein [Seonamhaeicola sp. MEBiC1930]|uniref:META domain-containing protein n=1 Tax=Seonamhaeicola sp. MEBiC01930 TaxID=2976768 RepID=UPI003251C38F